MGSLIVHICVKYFLVQNIIMTIFILPSRADDYYKEEFLRHPQNELHRLLNYDIIRVEENNKTSQCDKLLMLNVYGVTFSLCLKEYSKMISSDVKVIIKNEETNYQYPGLQGIPKTVFTGKVNFDKNSFAFGHLFNDSFDGYFVLNSRYYYLEHTRFTVSVGKSLPKRAYLCALYRDNDIKRRIHFDGINETEHFGKFEQLQVQLSHSFQDFSEKERIFRRKRSISSASCTLHLVADHTFYTHVGQNSVTQTVSEMVSRVGEADVIFRGTDFNADGYGDNVGFQVVKITVFTNKYANGYTLGDESLDVYQYLDKFSEYNFDDVCLGTAFSYRDFDGGTIGLAWVASSNPFGPAGGICQKQIRYSEENKYYSLNTAIVTMLNYGRRLLSHEVGLVLTHEYGHNFGSPHDPTNSTSCSPDNEYGNFIMYPYASSGSKPNHDKFSPCSTSSINPVIFYKGSCLVTHSGPQCGNFIVEEGEDCDCGSPQTCAWIDPCCSPPGSTGVDPPCKYKRSVGYMCSTLTSPCCNSTCNYIQAEQNRVCSGYSECKIKAVCNGLSEKCPKNVNEPDDTFCDEGRKVCHGGICSRSICAKYNLDSCQCSGVSEHDCLVCCKHANSSTCVPAATFGIYWYDIQGKQIKLKPGRKCNSKEGFCNKYGKCIVKDNLDLMRDMFSKETADEIQQWFNNHWYYVVLVIATLVFLVIVFMVTKKKPENVQVDAFRLGRLENFVRTAHNIITEQEESLKNREEYLDKLILSIQRGQKSKTSYIEALGRLTTFFPTAPQKLLSDTLKKSSDEATAVSLMIGHGYPVLKLVKDAETNHE